VSAFAFALTLFFGVGTIPVAGIPMQVIRTCDSRDKRVGDFGVGWTLGLKNIRLPKNRTIGNNGFENAQLIISIWSSRCRRAIWS